MRFEGRTRLIELEDYPTFQIEESHNPPERIEYPVREIVFSAWKSRTRRLVSSAQVSNLRSEGYEGYRMHYIGSTGGYKLAKTEKYHGSPLGYRGIRRGTMFASKRLDDRSEGPMTIPTTRRRDPTDLSPPKYHRDPCGARHGVSRRAPVAL